MAFREIQFNTVEEFYDFMQSAKLNFLLFDEVDAPSADPFPLEEDEAGYYVDVRKLNRECFDRFMKNSAVERRADPSEGEIIAIPLVRSFIRGHGFISRYRKDSKHDLGAFLERSRLEKR